MGLNGDGAMQGAVSGAASGAAAGPWGALIGGAAGGLMGALSPQKKGPDYSNITNLYNQRNIQIGQFAASLADARAKYLTSLNNMYNTAYSRFSGTAEAGFANRGLAVNGGAFASTLAKQTALYQSQLEPAVYQNEREDLGTIDKAYGANTNGYMTAISGGPALAFGADREDSKAFGAAASGLVGKLGGAFANYMGNRGSRSNLLDLGNSQTTYTPDGSSMSSSWSS